MNNFIEQLKEMDACSPAIEWIEGRGIDTVQEFWRVSNRADWMLWLLHRKYAGIDVPIRAIQDTAIEFAEMALPYAGKNRQICIDCIYATWQYLEGYISIDELNAVTDAADDAYDDYDAADAAAAAFDAADYVADAAAAVTIRAAAVCTANAAAEVAVPIFTNTNYTWIKIKRQQADIIRRYIPNV